MTHPEIVRYFMTIPEACRLILQANAMGSGGEIFVFDMGEQVKIVELAKKMIRLAGLSPLKDIRIVFTGLRPGEKLFEELLIGDNPSHTSHPRIMKAHEECLPWAALEKHLGLLQTAIGQAELTNIAALVWHLVPHGSPAEKDTPINFQPT